MRTLLLSLFFVTFSCICFASGKISCNDCSFMGTVFDAGTKKPVADVMIIAIGTALSVEQKVITDEQGRYKLPSLPSGTYTLRFVKNNYKPIERKNLIVKKNASKLNIQLLLDEGTEEDYHNWLLKVDFM